MSGIIEELDEKKGESLPAGMIYSRTMNYVELAKISEAHTYQVRATMDAETVEKYAEIYAEQGEEGLPPVDLLYDDESDTYEIINGYHRLEAARRAGLPKVKAFISVYDKNANARDLRIAILAMAAEKNAKNALQFSAADAKNAARLLLMENPNLKASEIRAVTGLRRSAFYYLKAEMAGRPRQYKRPEIIDRPEPEAEPARAAANDLILCANGCGTPTFPEHLHAEGSTWTQNAAGAWFCSEECKLEAESRALDAAGTAFLEEIDRGVSVNIMENLDPPQRPTEPKEKAQRETREKKEEFEVEPCAICGKKPHFSRSAAGHVLFCSFCLTYLGMEIRTKPKNSERSAVLVWNTAMENARGLKEEKRRAAK